MKLFNEDPQAKKQFSALSFCFIASGICQGLSVGLLIPLMNYIITSHWEMAFICLIPIAVLALLCFIFLYAGTSIGNKMAVFEVCDAQIHNIGRSLTKLPLGFFNNESKGLVSQVISTDINTLSHLPSVVLPEILCTVSASIVIAVVLTAVYWPIGIVLLVTGVLLKFFWDKNMRMLETAEHQKNAANKKMAATIVEFAQLQTVLRSAGALLGGWQRLDDALADDKKGTLKVMRTMSKTAGIYAAIANAGFLVTLGIGVQGVITGTLAVSSFMAIVVLLLRFAGPLSILIPYGTELYAAQVAEENINKIVKAELLPVADNPVALPKFGDTSQHSGGLPIELRNVNFSYIKGVPVLKNINLALPAGSMTALVGASGSGKSTITRLIARFWDTSEGQVLINGIDVRELSPDSLMASVSMVFQEVYLFNTSIKENVAIAKPGATIQEIIAAGEKAGLLELIDRLPNGWDTMVGEGGSLLSGGEKQRVSIARAFLKNAPILLLDEITSALDGTNEAIITRAITQLAKNRTVVVIAHRLSSIKNARQIAVIDQGAIAEIGSHDNLIAAGGLYNKLWEASQTSERWHL